MRSVPSSSTPTGRPGRGGRDAGPEQGPGRATQLPPYRGLTQRQGPEAHRRMLDKAAEIMRTGQNPEAVPIEDIKALISQRLGR
jgi:hypothetical protein